MAVRDLMAGDIKVLGVAKGSIATATTTNFDFGTPNDINLDTVTADAPGLEYRPGDRVLLILRGTTGGTTDTLSWSVQDAPDSAGSIGTPATAVTSGTLTGGTGDEHAIISVRVQPGRPWIRVRMTSTGTTDTFTTTCIALAIPDTML